MNQTHTGIAVALAVIVVGAFLVFPLLKSSNQADIDNGQKTVGAEGGVETGAVAGVDAGVGQLSEDTNVDNNKNMQENKIVEPFKELGMKDEVVGTGAIAAAGDKITVHYVGMLTNGKVFDASAPRGPEGFTFQLGVGQVIAGWDQGVAGMKVGGKRVLAIPAALAYGERGAGASIPANSDLLFQVELLKVEKSKK